MGKKLAIIGHPTRGNEVIKLLEMVGGKNCYNLSGLFTDYGCYFIGEPHTDGICGVEYIFSNEDICLFTLEEFFEKYPFKVGDKVVYTKFGDNCDEYPVTIESMKWTGTTIEYTFNDCVTCLAKDLKMWTGELDVVMSSIYLNSCDYADEVELYLGDYEIEVRDGKTYAVLKKPKYPTTYKECCEVIGISRHDVEIDLPHPYQQKMFNLFKLRICRDAYWKIAGEEMGLDKPWEPDWNHINRKYYCIYNSKNNIVKNVIYSENKILAFPTEEMRDTFHTNFKKDIEQCKEFL
jgi:hypothetical protein